MLKDASVSEICIDKFAKNIYIDLPVQSVDCYIIVPFARLQGMIRGKTQSTTTIKSTTIIITTKTRRESAVRCDEVVQGGIAIVTGPHRDTSTAGHLR